MTPLDRAHGLMEAAPDDDRKRLSFYARLVDGELFLLLEQEPDGPTVEPRLVEADGIQFVAVFDTEERLAEFAGQAAAYAALPGRAVTEMLSEANLGLALNFGVAPSSFLLPPDGVTWLQNTLAVPMEETTADYSNVSAPRVTPELLTALDARLARAAGLAKHAVLVAASVDDQKRMLVALVGATDAAQPTLARAVSEAAALSGTDVSLDVAFFNEGHATLALFDRVGLKIELPEQATETGPSAPGMDPTRPPRL